MVAVVSSFEVYEALTGPEVQRITERLSSAMGGSGFTTVETCVILAMNFRGACEALDACPAATLEQIMRAVDDVIAYEELTDDSESDDEESFNSIH